MLKTVMLLVLAWLAYWPVSNAPLLYEDAQTTQATFRRPTRADLTPGRYLTSMSVALDTWRTGGSHAGYHQTNLAVHVVNALLLWWLVRKLGADDFGALVAVGLFLFHLIQTQAVSYISGRGDLLATTGVLVTCLLWLRDRWELEEVSAIVVTGIVAMMVKESAVALLGILLILSWRQGYDWRQWAIPWGGLAGMALLGLPMIFAINNASDADPMRYLAAQLTTVWAYLGLVVFPRGLSIEHDVAAWPWIVPLLALPLSIIIVGIAWVKRQQIPIAALAIGWVVAAILPRLIVRMPDLLYERHMYLPLIGIWIGVGLWASSRDAPREEGAMYV